ncbi:MAG: hypothetical protein LBV17_09065 [Treponema sp.]|jgi:hypothetical protein|nr:hypothetical protein [Treponema sp.]
MRNKGIITFIIIISAMTNSLFVYPQEQSEHNGINDNKTPGTDFVVIEKKSIFSIFPYKLSNGTKLSYNDTLQIVKSLGHNEALLKEERGYQIASNILFFTYGMGIIGGLFLDNIQRNNNIQLQYLLVATVGIGIPAMVTKGIAEKKLSGAVHNYNLYVMGIKINN